MGVDKNLPKGWEWKKLGEVCEIYNGSTPSRANTLYWNGNILWATPTDVSHLKSKYIEDTSSKITQEGYENCSTHLLPIGTVLFTSRASIGHIAITKKELCTNQGFKNFACKDELIPEFLYYCLKLKVSDINSLASGSTFKEISMSSIRNIEIPVPKIQEQKKIVEILEYVEKLIQRRKKASDDTLCITEYIFYKMFGNPSDSKYSIKKLEEVCKKITDGSHRTPKLLKEGYPFLTVANMGDRDFDYTDCKMISEEEYKDLVKNDCKPLARDVLFSKDGTVGKVMEIKEEKNQVLLSSISILRPNPELINSTYLATYMKSSFALNQAINMKSGSAIRRIILRDIKKISIPLPPKSLQEQFAGLVRRIENIKQYQEKSTSEINNLFDALMQKAFKGELIT